MPAKITSPHDYQGKVINESFEHWQNGYQNICLVAPTGAGKTVIKAFTAKRFLQENPDKMVVIFAHRDVLLTQISCAVGSIGLPHRMICARKTEVSIGNTHLDEFGESYLSDKAKIIIASVPTWIKRDTRELAKFIGLWCMDEFHHTLVDNMWGKAVNGLNHAIGLGVTATPIRTDGKGLGRHACGVADVIIETPKMGELIKMKRLSPYKVYTPPDRVDTAGINITAGGDYNQKKLAKATDKKDITGDAVDHYLRLAKGKQGIIFAASVAHAEHVAQQFRESGVNAIALSSTTHDAVRERKIREFRQGKIELLVNYDLFGEGFDVPAVEVVIMLRKTMSFGLFKQMFGRCLRVLKGKLYGILIDHVGNVSEHVSAGSHLHDDPEWTLNSTKKKSSTNGIDIITRVCSKCFHYYTPLSTNIKSFVCPDCGHAESDIERNTTQKEIQVNDGVLVEFDTGFFDEIMKEIRKVDKPPEEVFRQMQNAPRVAAHSAVNNHKLRQEAQYVLRVWIVNWCNETGAIQGLDVSTTQNEFTRIFSVNIFKAQTLGARLANELTEKIQYDLLERRLFV
jgi:superfamily II DNA or RNA helicase